jgi:hypothetical protein
VLREQVTSKGGTTAAALAVLDARVCVLSSPTPWRRPIAAPPNSPRNSAIP